MSSTSIKSAGNGTNTNDGGNNWATPDNIVSSNDSWATCLFGIGLTPPGNTYEDDEIRLLKGGTPSATNHSTGANWANTTDAVFTYGNPTDLWGETWLPADINASNFGARLQIDNVGDATIKSNYLDASDFGFAIPSTAVIDGIELNIERHMQTGSGMLALRNARVDHMEIVVYYTDKDTPSVKRLVRHGRMGVWG